MPRRKRLLAVAGVILAALSVAVFVLPEASGASVIHHRRHRHRPPATTTSTTATTTGPTTTATAAPDPSTSGTGPATDPGPPTTSGSATTTGGATTTSAGGTTTSTRSTSTNPPAPTTVTTVPAGNGASAAQRLLGPTRSGLPWHSGAWVGGRFNAAGINGFAAYRGSPADVVTTYAEKDSWANMAGNDWSITTWNGFAGKLNFGLSLLPTDGSGSLQGVANGDQNWVWTQVATNLKRAGRGDSIVRIGWEQNIPDWKWYTTTANAAQYRAAFRQVVTTMRAVAPDLTFDFGVNCGSGLNGSSDRLAPLTMVYPGDDVVDIVGCDTYDWWTTEGHNDATWGNVLHPGSGPGIQDVVDFARAHHKGAGFGEWGLAATTNHGAGDNPYYVEHMFSFFQANADVVAYECYFDEPDGYIANSLSTNQNPQSAASYKARW